MSDNVYAQVLNLIDTLAQKQTRFTLSEFEYKLFESLCNSMTVYFDGLKFAFHSSAYEVEMKATAEKAEYLKWRAEQEKIEAEQAAAEQDPDRESEPEEPKTEE